VKPSDSAVTPSDDVLRVVFVGAHDSAGGAARAMTRIFRALWERQEELGLDLSMRVIHKTIDHPAIVGGRGVRNKAEYTRYYLKTRFRKYFPRKKFISSNKLLHSQAVHHSGLGRELRAMNADLYVLNWLGNGTLSIPEIGRLSKRVVWQLHDMWMFSGAEHYTDTERAARGYSRATRPADESGPDIDRETFRRKKRHWRRPMPVIVPSSWLAGEAKKSTLTGNWPIHVQPYPLDTDFWQPQDKSEARKELGLPSDHLIVLFGAAGGTSVTHKGADLLFDALPHLKHLLESAPHHTPVSLAIFGEAGEPTVIGGIPVSFLGDLDDEALRLAYSASDILVVPSRLENFAQVALEGHSCGLPGVVFEKTGLTDIVGDGETGYHAAKNDPKDLALKISHLVLDGATRERFSQTAREKAVRLWDPNTVARDYGRLLHAIAESPPFTRLRGENRETGQ
jgi:glycosyltransferase involved in cell wall biosynthesis